MAWTTAADVIAAWIGDDAPSDPDKLDVWIGKAERLIAFHVPDIQARIDIPEPGLLENVKDVVTAMVMRKFRNPEGIRQASITTGPFSEQRTYGGDDPGELLLLDSELAMLSGGKVGGGAFAIDLIPSTSYFSETNSANWRDRGWGW